MLKIINAVLITCFLLFLMLGCAKLPDPIDRILLMKAPPGQVVPPVAALSLSQKDPIPTIVWEFSSSDKLYVGIRLSKEIKEDVSFTKYIFFNVDTLEEVEVGLPGELGPYEPGQIPLINPYNKWVLPTEKGHYEFRIYLGERIVSKALFNIIGS